jgi:hypothetical protein
VAGYRQPAYLIAAGFQPAEYASSSTCNFTDHAQRRPFK